jgi:hypothetical protein
MSEPEAILAERAEALRLLPYEELLLRAGRVLFRVFGITVESGGGPRIEHVEGESGALYEVTTLIEHEDDRGTLRVEIMVSEDRPGWRPVHAEEFLSRPDSLGRDQPPAA